MNDAATRNVSIITARNSQKDILNKLGAHHFAKDTNQELIEFFSIDRISSRAADRQKWQNCTQSGLTRLSKQTRRMLWDAMSGTTTEFVAGKLSLCVGMPVMLCTNDAPEMCITKGQEGIVVGWDSAVGPSGQNMLNTLFVELMNPPRPVQLEDLPLNVVPLVRIFTHVTALLPDDTVPILINFGMTDYTAQGKSRLKNPVQLSYCKDHRAYYVALSRGLMTSGTIIVQKIDEKKITSGMSGYLSVGDMTSSRLGNYNYNRLYIYYYKCNRWCNNDAMDQ
ncbi:hypothetical protein C8R44DRAFT_948060 [Mycena epipterygia]|nr:hypothetical protein C8R44DRAFT_948060 [Mycena epipterygia]